MGGIEGEKPIVAWITKVKKSKFNFGRYGINVFTNEDAFTFFIFNEKKPLLFSRIKYGITSNVFAIEAKKVECRLFSALIFQVCFQTMGHITSKEKD
jgi:hypothetical protein